MYEPPEIAVLIVAHRGRDLLEGCIEALQESLTGYAHRILVVENGAFDDTAAWLARRFPDVRVLSLEDNLGFAAGNNQGWSWLVEHCPTARYLALVNQDVTVERDWLAPLLALLESDSTLASVQPVIRLDPPRARINTLGTVSHFLGFGFPLGYRQELAKAPTTPLRIDSVSGAACVIRAELVRRYGLFDPRFFMYLEDVELGWKLRLAGYDHAVVPGSNVYHQYTFDDQFRHYEHFERNRLWLLAAFLRWRTLLLLGPAWLFMELGQLVFAITRGKLQLKLRSYAYFCRPTILRELAVRRRELRGWRRLDDRELMARFTGRIESPELQQLWLVRYIATPVLSGYWSVVRRLLAW